VKVTAETLHSIGLLDQESHYLNTELSLQANEQSVYAGSVANQ